MCAFDLKLSVKLTIDRINQYIFDWPLFFSMYMLRQWYKNSGYKFYQNANKMMHFTTRFAANAIENLNFLNYCKQNNAKYIFYAYILERRLAQHCKIWIMLPFSPNWKLKVKMWWGNGPLCWVKRCNKLIIPTRLTTTWTLDQPIIIINQPTI